MNAKDILFYGHQKVEKTLKDFPNNAWETKGACGVWSAKDIMSHLASYEQLMADVLATFCGEKRTPVLDSYRREYKAFNDTAIAQRKNRKILEIIDEYNAAHTKVMEYIQKIPQETCAKPGTIPWYGEQYSLDDFIVYVAYGHKREHAAQIEAFKDRMLLNEV